MYFSYQIENFIKDICLDGWYGNKIWCVFRIIQKVYPNDISIQEIADQSHVSRDTVSKYMLVLAAEGKIQVVKQVGKAKLYESIK